MFGVELEILTLTVSLQQPEQMSASLLQPEAAAAAPPTPQHKGNFSFFLLLIAFK